MKPGKIITFYSYKGGTGRTMALANTACILAERSDCERGVLMIDWDLEAPGLHRFFVQNKNSSERESFDQFPGLIDLWINVKFALEKVKRKSEFVTKQQIHDIFAKINIKKYIRPIDIQGFGKRQNPTKLFLIKAGKFDTSYPGRVSRFPWEEMFKESPWVYVAFAEELAKLFDYVLVDSRTGITDISGICTMIVPENLVVVFTPNFQSLTGITDLVKRAVEYRKSSDDLRPLIVFPLPSRIEANLPDLMKKWRDGDLDENITGYQNEFEGLLAKIYHLEKCDLKDYFDNIQIQHIPYYAYGEKIAVQLDRSEDRFSIAKSYRIFTERLVNGTSPWSNEDVISVSTVEEKHLLEASINESKRKQLNTIRNYLKSSMPGDIWKGMEQARKWVNVHPEDQDIYSVLLDAIQENFLLRDDVQDLLNDMSQKGSKSAADAMRFLPVNLQDLQMKADDAYYTENYENALRLYRQVLQLEPDNKRAQSQLAKAELQRIPEKPNKNIPKVALMRYRKARSSIAAGEIQSAIRLLNAAIEEAQVEDVNFPEAEQLLNTMQNLLEESYSKKDVKRSYKYDVFINYSHRDTDWVTKKLLPSLEEQRLRVCLDFRDFELGASNIIELERAVVESRKTLVVLTPDYLNSQWTEFENILIQTTDPAESARNLIPILLKPCDLPLRLRAINYLDFTKSDTVEFQLKRLITSVKHTNPDLTENKFALSNKNLSFSTPVSVLFLSADPTDASRLILSDEVREIQSELQSLKSGRRFKLNLRPSNRPADISQALLEVQPQIVHFSGHGSSSGALYFENQIGQAQPVEPDALATLFEQFTQEISCVLLHACYSEVQAAAIANHIQYVVGMSNDIGDRAAIAFTIGFYQALGAGRTIEEAYKLGCAQIRLQNVPEHLTPVLIKKEGLPSYEE